MERERFVILDGHGLIFRAIYRPGPPLTSPSGEPTRGTYTFCTTLFALVEKLRPSYMAMAMDAPRKSTFRRKLYPHYKAHRKGEVEGPPKEVLVQLSRCHDVAKALGLPMLGARGFEADDVIATLVDVCASDEVECVIVTRDKDMQQLVGKNCRIVDPMTFDWIGKDEVRAKWGVPPKKLVELFMLQGDKSDGIPGIKGIGPKRAKDLILEHGTAEAARRAGKKGVPLCSAEHLDLMRKLVTLRTDVPIDATPDTLAFNGWKMKNAVPLFRQLGFKSFL